MANAYSEMGKYQEAYNNYTAYSAMKDSIKKEETLQRVAEIRTKYETAKKEKALKAEKLENKKKELKLKKEKEVRNLLLAGFGFILVITVLLLRSYRIQQRSRKKVEKAYEELEEKNEEIQKQHRKVEEKSCQLDEALTSLRDSIHYAKRIQKAVLQSEEHLTGYLPEHFILFKPKDVVSGDFYWALEKETKEHRYFYLMAADCTGHGVPGAFMSMLGVSFLNEITRDQKMLPPQTILEQLREKVIKELGQKGRQGETSDGMDVSLMRLEMNSLRIKWPGANNPFWLVRPSGEEFPEMGKVFAPEGYDHHLLEIKGDKQPVGYSSFAQPFTAHELQLQKGDTLYLFTDGFADQFGGIRGKKFKYRRMKDLLLKHQDKSMEQQKATLGQTFEEWKSTSDQEQVDDVCVIGVRV